jgi:hypothetical protein
MKPLKFMTVLLMLGLVFVLASPASAQLGDTDVSTFTIQNVSGGQAEVVVTFVGEDGTTYEPVNLGSGITNPFNLQDGEAKQINPANISTADLPSGRYSVVISSNAAVVAQAGVAGAGSLRLSGAYTGFSSGATTTYLPAAAFNFYGWYSMISVQNVGTGVADVTVTITCSDGKVGTLTQLDIPVNASKTWALKNETPTGFTAATACDGSAAITSDQPIVAVNNQNNPTTGATNTFEASSTGSKKLYVTSLSNSYYGWSSALTIRKISAGDTTVTVDYGGTAWANSTCNLTDAIPSCKLFMWVAHTDSGRYGAVITSNNNADLLAVVGTTNASNSNNVRAIGGGSQVVAIPNVAKHFYGFVSAITCQNVSATPTTINISYAGYAANAYNHATTLNEGDSVQVFVPNEAFLPTGFQGGATITANAAGAEISCMAGNTNIVPPYPGDWNVAYNAFSR